MHGQARHNRCKRRLYRRLRTNREEYIAKYPASKSLINKVNGGHGSGINVGSEKAVGKYLKVLDADDWFLTENIPEFIKALENTDADVVLTPHHTINISNGEVKAGVAFRRSLAEYTQWTR